MTLKSFLNFTSVSLGYFLFGIFLLCSCVGIAQPVASFTVPSSGCSGYAILFTNTSTGATSYLWNFGDGTALSTAVNPSHVYANGGNYSIQLTATNGAMSSTYSAFINIRVSPVAAFVNIAPCGRTANFINSSYNYDSIYWDFGDGNVSNVLNPVYTYAANGTYNVYMVASSLNGCTDTAFGSVNTLANSFIDFIWDSQDCNPNVTFRSTSFNAYNFTWNFGDGDSSNTQNPTHQYNITGKFDVYLTINRGFQCPLTTHKTINVLASNTDEVFVPNAFSPNGDGRNDVFLIQADNDCTDYDLSIFDRWGVLLFETNVRPLEWDGTVNGKLVPYGAYAYLLKGGNFTKVGTITVIY